MRDKTCENCKKGLTEEEIKNRSYLCLTCPVKNPSNAESAWPENNKK